MTEKQREPLLIEYTTHTLFPEGAEKIEGAAILHADDTVEHLDLAPPPQSVVTTLLRETPEEGELISIDEVEAAIKTAYPDKDHIFLGGNLRGFCRRVNVLHNNQINVTKLRQLSILDLGCGAEHPEGAHEEDFEPWLCRALHHLGVQKLTGMDRRFPHYENGEGKTEAWNFEQADLLKKGALAHIPDNSLDVVNTTQLFGHDNGTETSPTLWVGRVGSPSYESKEQEVFGEVLRILKPGGILIVNHDFVYQKTGGPLRYEFTSIGEKERRHMKTIQWFDAAPFKERLETTAPQV